MRKNTVFKPFMNLVGSGMSHPSTQSSSLEFSKLDSGSDSASFSGRGVVYITGAVYGWAISLSDSSCRPKEIK